MNCLDYGSDYVGCSDYGMNCSDYLAAMVQIILCVMMCLSYACMAAGVVQT
jgi:hypothetical protein